jgi:trehalose 6-phosphate synthase
MAAIPGHDWLMRSLFAYDLVGFQAKADVQHFGDYVRNEAHAPVPGRRMLPRLRAARCAAAPSRSASTWTSSSAHACAESRDMYETHAREYSAAGCWWASTGSTIPRACRSACAPSASCSPTTPRTRRSATLIQIASPTRETVDAYTDILRELESLCGAINGDYGELDWMPVRYMHRTVARKRLPGLYRAAAVALVTPLRDGMNLVAKEYVAAQDPADPGVLVLSRFAGAAEQMKRGAAGEPVRHARHGEAIQQALQMPLEERRERHQKLLARIREQDIHWWRRSFLDALREAASER